MASRGSSADGTGIATRPPSAFATTHWSLVGLASRTDTEEGRAALEQLCQAYWPPLYWFARRRGLAPPDAEDLTQAFFEDVLERGTIACADPARGRFRTFLLAAFENFHRNQQARARRLKSGGGRHIVSVEELRQAESQLRDEPVTAESPQTLFDRKWALHLLQQTLDALRREYAAAGKAALFEELRQILWGGRGEVPYQEVARRLETSEGAIKVAVHRVRQRFRDQLRAEVIRTLARPEDADDEMRHLFAALGA